MPNHDPQAPAIELAHLTFAYEGSAPQLEDVNLTVQPGEVVVLTGPFATSKRRVAHPHARSSGPWVQRTPSTRRTGSTDSLRTKKPLRISNRSPRACSSMFASGREEAGL